MIQYIFFDANFIAHLYRIDKDCELLEWIKEGFVSKSCVVHQNQYNQSPCNRFHHPCIDLENLMSDEEVFEFTLSYPGQKPLQNIYDYEENKGDPADLKILACAYKLKDFLVLSCDKNLLILCDDLEIMHFCFKAVMVYIDKKFGGIFKTFEKTTKMFSNCDDPFFCFDNDKRCSVCHHKMICTNKKPSSLD